MPMEVVRAGEAAATAGPAEGLGAGAAASAGDRWAASGKVAGVLAGGGGE